jgi:hypothetical protein
VKILDVTNPANNFQVTILIFGRERIVGAPNLERVVEKIFALGSVESKEEIMDQIIEFQIDKSEVDANIN